MCKRSIHGVCERVIKRELRKLAREYTQTQNLLLTLEKDYNRALLYRHEREILLTSLGMS